MLGHVAEEDGIRDYGSDLVTLRGHFDKFGRIVDSVLEAVKIGLQAEIGHEMREILDIRVEDERIRSEASLAVNFELWQLNIGHLCKHIFILLQDGSTLLDRA